MTRVTVPSDNQHEDDTQARMSGSADPEARNHDITRLVALTAQLSLLIDEVELAGNIEAALSLRVQFHQALVDLLASTQQIDSGADPRTAEMRQRHQRKADAYRRELARRTKGK